MWQVSLEQLAVQLGEKLQIRGLAVLDIPDPWQIADEIRESGPCCDPGALLSDRSQLEDQRSRGVSSRLVGRLHCCQARVGRHVGSSGDPILQEPAAVGVTIINLRILIPKTSGESGIFVWHFFSRGAAEQSRSSAPLALY